MDYYAELELTPDATADEIKRQYKKLALQYHPDRHPGKEGEVVPRFQAIGQAHEVLLDPEQRRKYDLSRQRKDQQPSFPRQANTSRRQDPSFPNATTNWDPPPRRNNDPRYTSQRTDSNRFAGPQAQHNGAATGSTGASRYTNWANQPPQPPPRTANTSSKAEAKQRANVFNTWQNMRYANKSQTPYPHPPRPEPQQQQAPPQPPPRRPEGPHRPEGPQRGRAESIPQSGPFGRERPSSSSERFNTTAARGKPGFRVPPPFNGFNQSPTSPHDMRMPTSGGGGVPTTPGGMPPPPRSAGANYPPPPFFKQGPPPTHPTGGLDPESAARRGRQQPNGAAGEDPGDAYRHATPYTQHLNEKTYFDSDALRRSASTRDATRVAQQEAERKQREESHKRAQSLGRSPDSSSARSRPQSGYEPDDSDVESATSSMASMGMNGHVNGNTKSPQWQKPPKQHQRQASYPQAGFHPSPKSPQPPPSAQTGQQQTPPPAQAQPQQQHKEETPPPDAMDVDPPATGLDDMHDMSNNLPKSPQTNGNTASSGLHNTANVESDLPKAAHTASQPTQAQAQKDHTSLPSRHPTPSLPQPPRAPPAPSSNLTQSSWALYLNGMSSYMSAYAAFNSAMVSYFQDAAVKNEQRLKGPGGGMVDGWLGAVAAEGALGGWETYCEGLREDERVRLHWNVARERHAEVCEKHGRLRARVVTGELGGK